MATLGFTLKCLRYL